jgi:metalloreductase STEAP2
MNKTNKVFSIEMINSNALKNQNLRKEKVSIIGTGNFGIALGKRLIHYGFHVVFGSRSSNYDYVAKCLSLREDKVDCFTVNSIQSSFILSDKYIFVAVNAKKGIYENLVKKIFDNINGNELLEKELSNSNLVNEKVIIDISNVKDERERLSEVESNAEILDNLFAIQNNKVFDLNVVKGFNLLSAYKLTEDLNNLASYSQSSVPIAGNSSDAKKEAISLCNKIGLQAYDFGPLSNSRTLENANLKTFPEWLWTSVFSICYFLFQASWIFAYSPFYPRNPDTTFKEFIDHFSLMGHFSRVTGFCAFQFLAYVYLAGIVATLFQLYYGTKYRRFPNWLDKWLKARKQLGLWAFYYGSFHAIISLIYLNPGYLGYMETWYRKMHMENLTKYDSPYHIPMLTYHAELSMLFGIASFLLMALLAVTSINSVGSVLNWKEWRFVQTKLGYASLVFAFGHDLSMFLSFVIDEENKFKYPAKYVLTRAMLYLLIIPFIVMFFKICFTLIPPLRRRIQMIQEGSYVRKN